MVANHSHKECGNMIVGLKKKKLLKRSLRLNQYNKLTKTEWQKQFEIALASASLYFALWLVKKNHTTLSTNQTQDLSQSWFSRASGSFYRAFSLAPHCIFLSFDWPLWLLCFWSYDPKSRSALSFLLLRLTSTQVVKRDYYYANESTKRYNWL